MMQIPTTSTNSIEKPVHKTRKNTSDGWWKEQYKKIRYMCCRPINDIERYVNKFTMGNLTVKDALFSRMRYDVIVQQNTAQTSAHTSTTPLSNYAFTPTMASKHFLDIMNILRCLIVQFHAQTDNGLIVAYVRKEIGTIDPLLLQDCFKIHQSLVEDFLAHLNHTELLVYGYESNSVEDAVEKYNAFIKALRSYDFTQQHVVGETVTTGFTVRNLFVPSAPYITYSKEDVAEFRCMKCVDGMVEYE
jgi:hypothetical protein